MKRCPRCKVEKTESSFGRSSKRPDGLSSWCKQCNREASNAAYRANPGPTKARARKNGKAAGRKIRDWLRSIKAERGCSECGEMEPCTLEFHHIFPEDKEFSVTTRIARGLAAVERELRRCVVLCANCHKKVHAGLIIPNPRMRCLERFPRSVRYPPPSSESPWMRIKLRENPTLLTILKAGGSVTFPDGRKMTGDPSTGYLQIARNDQPLGIYSLDRDGLVRASEDRDFNTSPEAS